MNRFMALTFLAAAGLVVAPPPSFGQARGDDAPAQAAAKPPTSDDKHFVFADFEKADDNKKPISARGGAINVFPYQAPGTKEATVQGPELVHVKRDDPNHLLKFDYALFAPSDWTGVTLEIHGQPDVDGKMVPDDLSAFKVLSLDCFATGVPIIRVEILSQGKGKDTATAPPQYTFKVKEGLNTYKIPLKAFSQPQWVTDVRVDPKDVLKALTSVHVIPFCEGPCEANKQGMVILDNIVFEK